MDIVFILKKILEDLKKWNLHDDVDTENSSGLDEAGDDIINGFSNGSKNNLDNSIGAFVSRPKSAAPQLNSSRFFSSLNDDNEIQSSAFHDDMDIMNLGSRRSASTGLIHNEGNGKEFLGSRKHQSFLGSLSEEDGAHQDAGIANTSHHSNDASLENLNMNSLKNPTNSPVRPLTNPQSVNQVRRYNVL